MKNRISTEKLLLIAEGIFNSKVRYGSSVYLQPVFEKEDLKAGSLPAETSQLQKIQNNMLRVIFGYKLGDKTNMTRLRNNINMFSVNQMACYHVLMEAFNVINHSSSEVIHNKWLPDDNRQHLRRRERRNEVKVHVPNHVKCQGFTWYGAKMWNQLPVEIQELKNPDSYKDEIKKYIWDNIPSY